MTDDPMENRPVRATFILQIWTERSTTGAAPWRGRLESAGGDQWPFSSLDELRALLRDVTGWPDVAENAR